jgi:hypothetical protein
VRHRSTLVLRARLTASVSAHAGLLLDLGDMEGLRTPTNSARGGPPSGHACAP